MTRSDADLLADALERAGYSDWWVALYSAAMDEVHDVRRAVSLADMVHRDSPQPAAVPRDDDAAVVLGRATGGAR